MRYLGWVGLEHTTKPESFQAFRGRHAIGPRRAKHRSFRFLFAAQRFGNTFTARFLMGW